MLSQISEVSQTGFIAIYLLKLNTMWNGLLTFLLWEQLSGANVTLVEDRPDMTQKTIQISGTPDQTERAQSLLQGFILSSKSLSDTHIQLYFVDMHARFLDSLVK